MPKLRFRRVRFSREADVWLRTLKARTGITPNVLARFGLCLSLESEGAPLTSSYPEDSDREISRPILVGDHEEVIVALIQQRLLADGDPTGDLDDAFRAHVHRGLGMLANRVKTATDLIHLHATGNGK